MDSLDVSLGSKSEKADTWRMTRIKGFMTWAMPERCVG